ncbi:hypothetical protein [Spirillospora sp. NPDC048819]|uniref:hypothetical protein n=1 Tax=Spirillospora sp. NPDC048819 TaxID=3155268 RepID=UPI00340C59BF
MEPKAVGVDGRPVWHGVGRMVAVTEPGEHLVEVWGHGSAETVRGIRAEAGQVAELDYRMPASMGGAEGVLVPAPGSRRRRMGSGVRWGWVPILVVSAAWLIDEWRDLPETSAVGVGVLVCAVLAGVLAVAVKQRADRRYRVRMSHEAGADPRAAETGMFLADGRCPAGIAEGDIGALLITETAERKYSWNGLGFGRRPVTDPNAWLPWPTLAIDGARRPFAWRSWCYRLPPGAHEVTVEPASDRPKSETAAVKVEIAPGRVTRVDLRVKADVAVQARDRDVPTEPAGFEATADLKVSAPS